MAANKRKLLTMILLGTAVVAILLLAAGLAQVRFTPGEPFSLARAQQSTPPPMGVSAELSPAMRMLLRVWFILTLTLLPFSVFYLLLSPEARKRIIPNLIVFGVFMLIMSSLGKQVGQMLGENGVLGGLGDMTGLTEGGASVQPVEFSSSAPSWLVIAISFVVAVIVVALGGSLIYALLRNRSRRRSEEALPLVRIAEEAESALTAIAAGGDLRDTVIRCYVEMSRTVRAAAGSSASRR